MNVLTDLHTHTYPSSHDGKNSLKEMIEKAVEMGVKYYGVSNHFDYDYDENLMTDEERERLQNGDEAEYFNDARILKKEYAGQINFLVGAEFGYSEKSDVQNKYSACYEKFKPDYVINSVHGDLGRDFAYSTVPNDKVSVFKNYLRLVRNSLDVAYHYDIVGHIEYVVRYVPFEEKFIALSEFQIEIDDILTTVIEKDKILEVNSSVYGLNRICLPSEDIIRRYYALGGRKISFGSDAHATNRILDGREKVVELLKRVGFDYLTVPSFGEDIKVSI